MNKRESPSQQVWKRFKKNRLALFSLFFILLACFTAVFCYVIIPDRTPLAARMNLSLNNKPPGFHVRILNIPKENKPQQNFFEKIFTGTKDLNDKIAVSAWRKAGDKIFYREFTGDEDSLSVPEQSVELSKFLNINQNQSAEISSAEFEKQFIENQSFPAGSDRYGRDMLSRVLAGTRVTLGVGLIAVIISLVVGVFLGSLAGFFRGWVDATVLWLINVVWSIPTLLLVIAITLVMGKGFSQVFIAVGLTMWVDVARIVRSQLFSVRELEFVSAGRAMGFRNPRIILYHMLPNVIGPVLVIAAANFSTAILLEAGLSFLGIGAQPPTPSWGAMIKENYGYIIIPGSAYLAILPGLAIMLLTMAFTFVANGLRDAIDSKMKY